MIFPVCNSLFDEPHRICVLRLSQSSTGKTLQVSNGYVQGRVLISPLKRRKDGTRVVVHRKSNAI
jgi:hypothetical protein